mgnify:CR=1 FL=1
MTQPDPLTEIIQAIGKKPFYQDSAVVIYHADNREILPLIPEKSIDLVLTDPPYGIGYKPQKHNSKTSWGDRNFCATDILHGDSGLLDFNATPIYEQFKYAWQVWWGANNYQDSLPRSRGWLVWFKARGMEGTDFSHAELAWTNKDMPIRLIDYLWQGSMKDGERTRSQHPTQKPLAVISWCLSFFIDSIIVLDPYLGSGTTAVAAKKLGRKCIGIEIEEKYCEIAAKRCSQSVMPLEIPPPKAEQSSLPIHLQPDKEGFVYDG